jgi:hypothetical protein
MCLDVCGVRELVHVDRNSLHQVSINWKEKKKRGQSKRKPQPQTKKRLWTVQTSETSSKLKCLKSGTAWNSLDNEVGVLQHTQYSPMHAWLNIRIQIQELFLFYFFFFMSPCFLPVLAHRGTFYTNSSCSHSTATRYYRLSAKKVSAPCATMPHTGNGCMAFAHVILFAWNVLHPDIHVLLPSHLSSLTSTLP